jgi:hypothetical protein
VIRCESCSSLLFSKRLVIKITRRTRTSTVMRTRKTPNNNLWFRRATKTMMRTITSPTLRSKSKCNTPLTVRMKMKRCWWIWMNSMTRKSNSYYNTCKRSTKSIRNSSLFPRNILTRSYNKKILNSWEIKLEFCNSLKTVSIKTKTKRARCKLKAASNRSMTKSTKMRTSSSLSLKSRWCCSSNRPPEVVKNQKNLN